MPFCPSRLPRDAPLLLRSPGLVVAGYSSRRFTFPEPRVTKAASEQKANFRLAVPQPPKPGRATLSPITLDRTFDRMANASPFVLAGLRPVP